MIMFAAAVGGALWFAGWIPIVLAAWQREMRLGLKVLAFPPYAIKLAVEEPETFMRPLRRAALGAVITGAAGFWAGYTAGDDQPCPAICRKVHECHIRLSGEDTCDAWCRAYDAETQQRLRRDVVGRLGMVWCTDAQKIIHKLPAAK